MVEAVEMRSVTLTYWSDEHGLVTAVDSVNLSIPAGVVLGLLGPNGSGKTSLLKALACRLAPNGGSVRLNGYHAVRERDEASRQVVAQFDGPGDVEFGHLRAPIVLVDDCTEAHRDRLRSLCATIRERQGTLVFATHDTKLARELCDRIAVIDEGRLVADLPVVHEADLAHEAHYAIEVKGRLDARRVSYFEGLDVTATDEGTTTISGLVADQAALHGLLTKVRDLGLPLLSVKRAGLDLDGILARYCRDLRAGSI